MEKSEGIIGKVLSYQKAMLFCKKFTLKRAHKSPGDCGSESRMLTQQKMILNMEASIKRHKTSNYKKSLVINGKSIKVHESRNNDNIVNIKKEKIIKTATIKII